MQAAVGFFRKRALDQTGIHGRLQVVLAQGWAVGQAQFLHAGQSGQWLFDQTLQQSLDLVADLIAHLVGGSRFEQGLQQGREQEFDEGRGLARLSSPSSIATSTARVAVRERLLTDEGRRERGATARSLHLEIPSRRRPWDPCTG